MVQRKFILGDEWLYYKLYCGARTADVLLSELILPLARELQEQGDIDQWFFIRYSDPDPHIRLRFHLCDVAQIGTVIAAMRTAVLPYIQDKRVWKIQTDTYVREMERYGTSTMAMAERLFHQNSVLVSKALSVIEEEELFFLFTLKSIHSFVKRFQRSDEENLIFYQKNAAAFKTEFSVAKPTKLSLDKKYRGLRKTLEDFFVRQETEYDALWELLEAYHKEIDSIITSLLHYQKEDQLEIPLDSLLSSFVHMAFNRAFRHKQRFYEMLGYDFLARYTQSNLKRKKII